ncbi:MAG: hypothetical protein PHV63_04295 [Candidatus Daviesbacteria bacterium]|nr:hypothetical protein [Candidatus Daviesbacteria bacterium]
MQSLSVEFIFSSEWWSYLILSILSSSLSNFVDLNSGKVFRLIGYIGLFSLIGLLFLTTLTHGWFGGLVLLVVLIMIVLIKQKVVWKIYRKDISADKRPIFDLIMKGVPLEKDSHPAYLTKEFYRKLKEFLDWP